MIDCFHHKNIGAFLNFISSARIVLVILRHSKMNPFHIHPLKSISCSKIPENNFISYNSWCIPSMSTGRHHNPSVNNVKHQLRITQELDRPAKLKTSTKLKRTVSRWQLLLMRIVTAVVMVHYLWRLVEVTAYQAFSTRNYVVSTQLTVGPFHCRRTTLQFRKITGSLAVAEVGRVAAATNGGRSTWNLPCPRSGPCVNARQCCRTDCHYRRFRRSLSVEEFDVSLRTVVGDERFEISVWFAIQ